MRELKPTEKIITGNKAKNYKVHQDLETGETVIRYIQPSKKGRKSKVALVIIENNKRYRPEGTRGGDDHGGPEGHDETEGYDGREGPGVTGGYDGPEGPGVLRGYDGPEGPGGTGGYDGPVSSNDKEDKKLGKAIKIGAIAIASIAMLIAIANAKDIEFTEHSNPSDFKHEIEQSDLYPDRDIDVYEEIQIKQDENGEWIITNEDGEQIRIEATDEKGSSQIENPGELISILKERAAAERLGRSEGRKEYDSTSESERIEEENTINEITDHYDEQTKIIIEARKVLEKENASEQEKREALEKIEDAKNIQYNLFEENKELFNKYFNEAINEYTDSQYIDENVNDDVKYLVSILEEWNNSKNNLKGDIARLKNFDYVLDNPEVLFKEPSPGEGSKDEDYYIEAGPVKILKSETREIQKKVYEKQIDSQKSYWVEDGVPTGNGQIGEGTISVEATENVTLKTTRYGINAVVHKFGRFVKNLAQDAKNMIEDVKDIFDNEQEK